jgi:hypothetical protein
MTRPFDKRRRFLHRGVLLVLLLALGASTRPVVAANESKRYALESASGLVLHNVAAEPVTLHDRKGLRLTLAPQTARRLEQMSPEERALADVE